MTEKKSPTALVIEDEPSISILCERVLTKEGYTVDPVNNGIDAEKMVEEHYYDLILCDIRLPEVSGIDFYVWLQQEHSRLAKNVVFMTGSVMGGESVLFLEKSGRPHILKPFRPDDLLETIKKLRTG
jgi:CheY-like chemotaxis protein